MASNEGFESSIPAWVINDPINAWTRSTDYAQAGSYSLKSGAIADSKHTQFDCLLNVSSSGTFSFYHRTSSESGYDKLFFFIDGALQTGFPASGTPGSFTQFSTTLGTGLHCLQWIYAKDSGGSSGNDAVYIDTIVFPANSDVTDYGESFESGVPGDWTNDGTYPWTADTTQARFGSQSVKSGGSGVGGVTSTLQTTETTGAGEAYCWMATSSEPGYDFTKWYIDGVEKAALDGIAGENADGAGFIFFKETVTAASHTFKWEFTKDGGGDYGDDQGNLDGFFFPAAGGATGKSNPLYGPFGGPLAGVL